MENQITQIESFPRINTNHLMENMIDATNDHEILLLEKLTTSFAVKTKNEFNRQLSILKF